MKFSDVEQAWRDHVTAEKRWDEARLDEQEVLTEEMSINWYVVTPQKDRYRSGELRTPSTHGLFYELKLHDKYRRYDDACYDVAVVLRMAELKTQLDAWVRGEADWPKSRRPPAPQEKSKILVWQCGVCTGGAHSGMECLMTGPPICEKCRALGKTEKDIVSIQEGQPADGSNFVPAIFTS